MTGYIIGIGILTAMIVFFSYYKVDSVEVRGTSHYTDDWCALGLDAGKKQYLSVWRRSGKENQIIPLPQLKGKAVKVRCAYPQNRPASYQWNEAAGTLSVKLEKVPCARVFEIEYTEA